MLPFAVFDKEYRDPQVVKGQRTDFGTLSPNLNSILYLLSLSLMDRGRRKGGRIGIAR